MGGSRADAVRKTALQVVVTGASSGIGRAIVAALTADRHHVFATVRRNRDAAALREAFGRSVTPMLCDLTDDQAVRRAADEVRQSIRPHGLDALVNNAGIAVPGPIEALTDDDLRRQFEINVIGLVHLTQRLLPAIRAAGGRIVNISSDSGLVASPFLGAYGASKFAVEALSDALRLELRPLGVAVSLVEPGPIDTPIWRKGLEAAEAVDRAADPRVRGLYADRAEAVRRYAERCAAGAAPPQRVAEVVRRVLAARRPRSRYPVGFACRLTAFAAHWAPPAWRDRILQRALGGATRSVDRAERTTSRTVLITGASSGIGYRCAADLNDRGFDVIATGLDPPRNPLPNVCFIRADLTDGHDVERLVGAVGASTGSGGLGGLVHSAGMVVGGPLEAIPIQRLRDQLDVNVWSAVRLTRRLLPALRAGAGRVVNVSSHMGVLAMPFLGAYGASKHAMEALSDALRMEVGPLGVAVTVVRPGPVATSLWPRSIEACGVLRHDWPDELRRVYERPFLAAVRVGMDQARRSIPVGRVVGAIGHALESPRPRRCYVVGLEARLTHAMRHHLPAPARDAVLCRALRRRGR